MGWNFYNSNGEALVQHAESEATQAEMEAETAGAKFAPPDMIKYSPGVAKVWCRILADGTLDQPDYNVASVTDTGTGDRIINYTTDFSDISYGAVSSCSIDVDNGSTPALLTYAVGSIRLLIKNSSGTDIDEIGGVVICGDQ